MYSNNNHQIIKLKYSLIYLLSHFRHLQSSPVEKSAPDDLADFLDAGFPNFWQDRFPAGWESVSIHYFQEGRSHRHRLLHFRS